ncbi:MAG: PrsW family intramembrane metalloprotease [bacterium]|nr:PrsW family intramembrane metalloprotease [bacterium]
MPPLVLDISLILLGFFPSIIWLGIFLRKDSHPEPRYMLIRTFLMGMILAPVAVGLQWAFVGLGEKVWPEIFAFSSAHFFLWAAFVEEIVKYWSVKFTALNNPEFDEPVDAMIYMITASLGFAAIENILVLFRSSAESVDLALQVWALRSVGATLLHALSGAIIGYFLALSWFYFEHQRKLITIGVILATLFHFTFNVLVFSFPDSREGFIYSLILLLVFAGLIQVLFRKVKERSRNRPVSTV